MIGVWNRDKKEVKGGATKGEKMEIALTYQNIVVFLIFVGVIFLLYKTFKIVTKAIIIAVLSFLFPWIVNFLKLPVPVSADIHTAVQFMFLGLALFLIYEFWHIAKTIISLILKPFRWVLKRRRR